MTVHEEYLSILESRFPEAQNGDYETRGYYDGIYYGPDQYQNESEMLEYLKKNPKATLKEAFAYFDDITPDGLAPGDDGADLLDDD